MSGIDWFLALAPALLVIWVAWRVHRYSRSVAGFLAGGRVAGRYMVAVASGEAAMGLVSCVALFEKYYQSGFAIAFWQKLSMPLGLLMTLTGFIIYRYRQTRAMTLAQFFEVRYSRRFRIFAGGLAFVSGTINYALFPAVGTRFFMTYCKLPEHFALWGFSFPTFPLLMGLLLAMALSVTLFGGQLTIIVSDFVQGIFCYYAYALVIVAVFWVFSFREFHETMLARPEGSSFINPFDTSNLTEFNLLFVLIGLFSSVYNRMSWQGSQAFHSSAVSAHEQKMGGVLGVWRSGYAALMIMLLAIAAYTYMNHPDFAGRAEAVRTELKEQIHFDDAKTTATIQNQMMVPAAIRDFLPIGIVGVFCAIMIFQMVSTYSSYMHSWGSILVQDVLLPLRKGKSWSPQTQVLLLRLAISGVALFAFLFALYYQQTTYILMFFALTGAVYLGGAGAVIIGGLYWRRGTAAGAWSAMLVGASLAVIGFLCTQYWHSAIYPWLHLNSPATLDAMRLALSRLDDAVPFASWEFSEAKFPLSGQEILMITMISSVIAYVSVSLLTCRAPFDLDRMLHRGVYARKDDPYLAATTETEKRRSLWEKILGVNEEYTRGDRVLAWSVFAWMMANFGVFVVVIAWNILVRRWSSEEWFLLWKYYTVGLTVAVGAITTIWFTVGGAADFRKMFERLRLQQTNASDDGRVIGHSNADDVSVK